MNKKIGRKRRIFYLIIGAILLLLSLLNTYLLLKYKILPSKFIYVYLFVAVVIPILMVLYTLFKKRKTKKKGIILVFEFIYIIVLSLTFFYLNRTFNFLDRFTAQLGYETKQYIVLVLNDSSYSDIKNIKDKTVGYAKGLDSSIENAKDTLSKKVSISFKEMDGYGDAFSNLDNKNVDALILTKAY